MTDISHLLPDLEALAIDAGHKILAVYGTDDFQVQSKDDDSPLTAADMASHKAIAAGLAALTPDIPVLSEESADIPWETRQTWSRYWLVDPLDGTKEFIKRNGEFTVNIALIEGQKATLGIVHIPVEAVTYVGVDGTGAWKRTNEGVKTDITIRPLPEVPVVAMSRSHPSEALQAMLDGLGPCTQAPLGSALKFCRVAEGLVDFYPRLGLTSEWDTAAAQAVLEAAGGAVVKTDGTPMRYNTKDSLLNPHFFAAGDTSILSKVLD